MTDEQIAELLILISCRQIRVINISVQHGAIYEIEPVEIDPETIEDLDGLILALDDPSFPTRVDDINNLLETSGAPVRVVGK